MTIQEMQQSIPHSVNTWLNYSAVGTAFASFLGYLPNIAAGLSIAWLLFQFWIAWKTKPWDRK